MKGFHYFFRGLRLLTEPGVRAFVVLPLLFNLVIFVALTWYLLSLTGDFNQWITATLGDWAEWLLWLIWLVVGALWLIVYGFSFSMISNSIAAPFYGLLAEKVQAKLTGIALDQPVTFASFMALTRRTLAREWQKIRYLLPRLLGLLVISVPLYFIPVVGMVVPLLWFLWSSWSLALENLDYAADNNQVSFQQLRVAMKQRRLLYLSFGGAAALASAIPLFNLIAIPAAVAGGTALWLDHWPTQDKSPAVLADSN